MNLNQNRVNLIKYLTAVIIEKLFMKKQLTFLIFLFNTLFLFGQSDITVFNGYKYVYLAPLNYQDGSTDIWGIRSHVKEMLVGSGLSVLESTNPPQGIDVCLVVTCFIDHTNNQYKVTSDNVYLKFINCANEVVYASQGASGVLVSTFQQGLLRAAKFATSDFFYYKHAYDDSKSFQKKFEKNLPTLELTGLTEDSIKSYLTSKKNDPIEGIYKSYQSDGLPYYKLGIIKVGNIYKTVIIETELTYWKQGELKATFEPSSMKGLYSTKWYMGNKTLYETFATMENESLLTIEFKNPNSGEKKQDKFIKLFPLATNDITFNKGNYKSSGSGFFITTGGIIATNAHVVEDARNIEVTVSNEVGTLIYQAKILLVDAKNDVALLKIDDEKFKGLNSIPYGITENSDVGSKVFTIGYPLNNVMGSNYKVTDGIISSKSGIADDVRYYQISVPLQPGNSGGPLFNKEGNVIGITSAKLNGQAVGTEIENVNYAIKSSYLLNLYKMLPNSKKLSTTSIVATKELQDQVKILKNYVCLIKIF
jgi:S1-C subfamily serine protease